MFRQLDYSSGIMTGRRTVASVLRQKLLSGLQDIVEVEACKLR